ncbi:MAG: hypothetical protein P0116_11340 [Candidatus Nitrosocosmicus sp.]|nr:hypothetical protein [Candidatus Nitrosocosmicus sp.]
MSQIQSQQPTETIRNILLTDKKLPNYSTRLPELENTKESIELLKLEKKLSRSLLAILRYLVTNETKQNQSDLTKYLINECMYNNVTACNILEGNALRNFNSFNNFTNPP